MRRLLPILLVLVLLCGCGMRDKLTNYTEYYSTLLEESDASPRPKNSMRVIFLDVGQGDSCIIITPKGKTMVIDSGEYFAADIITDALAAEDVTRIDALIATHPHSDHIGGMPALMERFDIDALYLPASEESSNSLTGLLKMTESENISLRPLQADMNILLDDEVKISVISPLKQYEDENDCSAVLKVTHNDNDFLFMGDAGAAAEADLLATGIDVTADVIKLGHHGSETSSTDEFIRSVSPKYAIASCGENNDYGHPHKRVIELIKGCGAELYTTYESGHIIFDSTPKSLDIYCTNN